MIKKIIATLGISSAAVLCMAMPAAAHTQAAPDCQWGTSYGTIVTTAPVKAEADGSRVGTVEICRDSAYKYWGFVIYTSPMTASQYAQVHLGRYRDDVWESEITCDSPGGNKMVGPGQTRCWTPKFTGLSARYTFRAASFKYSSHTGDLLALGQTIEDR
ncbi:hypothetical protein [Amycolatopsis sp. lyj-112]|uniref:hypothetical protein n=1 Tax=Amycolatopsis sp. lyj-112 TaxID=2789288 RepID=UPI00397BC56A